MDDILRLRRVLRNGGGAVRECADAARSGGGAVWSQMNAGTPRRSRSGPAVMRRFKVALYRVLEVAVYVVTYVVLGVIAFKLVASLF